MYEKMGVPVEPQEFDAKLFELQRLLAEAYEHYFKYSDGHCKSSEGAISIHYPSFFWHEDVRPKPSIEVYSYVFGPSRAHHFDSIDEALEVVRAWHADEMATRYDAFGDVIEGAV